MINRSAIEHRTNQSFCYALNNEEVFIGIKTGKEIESVEVIQGDPFSWGIMGGDFEWVGEKVKVNSNLELENHLLWTIVLKPEYKRLKYYFVIKSKDEELFYFEDGFKESQKHDKLITLQGFTFPWINKNDVFETPDWVNQTIWYQIFPDRFNKSDEKVSLKNVKPWKKGVISNEYSYGGNLQGIYNKLDYLSELGISGIYFTPLFCANTVHKYDTTDYFLIDEAFGDISLFIKVVKKAHQLGIKIMIDCVFNHCGPDFAPWLDVLKNQEKSLYKDWFIINKFPVKNLKNTKKKEYYSFAYESNMPKLNTNNIEVQNYFLKVCDFWIDNCQIDAIRIDVANETAHDFNKVLRKHIKNKNQEIFILGEIWHDSISWLQGDEFDSVMNYPLMQEFNKMWLDKELTSNQFMCNINRVFSMYPKQATNVLFNLLDSHDTDRLITRFKDNNIVLQQLLLMFSMPGTPCIFYGTEIFLEGKHDPDCRRCMPWDEIEDPKNIKIINSVKEIINLRNSQKAMHSINYDFEKTEDKRVVLFNKYYQKTKLQIILNLEDKKINFKIPDDAKVLISNQYYDNILGINGFLVVEMEAHE